MKRFVWLLPLIVIIAFVLRVLYLPNGSLTFGYDQARDAVSSLQIAHGDLKILGPSSSTPGLYHGVLYYYVLAPAYLLGSGNPLIAASWIAFLNALVVVVCFALTYSFTKSKRAAVLAAVFFAVSFEATQYAVWLSNPTIGILTVPVFYLALWTWISGKKFPLLSPIIAGLMLGASIQSEIFLAYHAVPAIIWLFVMRRKLTKKQFVFFFISLGLALSTMILSEVKFGFKGIGGLLSLTSSGDAIVASKGFGDILILFFNQIGKVFAFSTYPGNIGYGAAIVFVSALFLIKGYKRAKKDEIWKPFLVTWLFSHITVVSLGGTSTPFLLVGIAPAVSILLAVTVNSIAKSYKVLAAILCAVIIVGNVRMILSENIKGQTIFSIQKDMLLQRQLDAIDYTYNQASYTPFSINTLTSPLWVNIVWAYLYNWHGQNKYGYTPTYVGHGQEGQIIALPMVKSPEPTTYLIIEPMDGIPQQYLPLTLGEEDARSSLISEKMFGQIRVQKRQKL